MTIGAAAVVALLSGLWLGWMLHQAYWRRERQQLQATIERISSERDASQLAAQELEAGLLIVQTVLGETNVTCECLQEDLVLRRRQLEQAGDENRRLRTYLERALYLYAGARPRALAEHRSAVVPTSHVDEATDTLLSRTV